MTSTDAKGRERHRRLTDPLRVLLDGGPPILESWLPELKDVFGMEIALSFGLRSGNEGLALDGAVPLGFPLGPAEVIAETDALFRSVPRWGYFDPRRPEPAQRNRAIALGPFHQMWERLRHKPRLFRTRFGMDDRAVEEMARSVERVTETVRRMGTQEHHRLRTLVCDGETLLAWVGGFRERPFGASEIHLLASVTPALSRRLALERLLGTAELTRAALHAALEQIARPAYVLAQHGAVAAANSLGRAALDRAPSSVRQRLSEALRNGDSDPTFRVSFLEGRGLPPHALAIEQGSPDVSDVTVSAARRWRLTPREQEVLVHIAMGRPNKAISSLLGCSDKTVELHVTRLLRKAEVDSRSALIARLWSQRG